MSAAESDFFRLIKGGVDGTSGGMLQVSAFLEDRRRSQDACITRLHHLRDLHPMLIDLSDQALRIPAHQWDDKRRLGHMQRHLFADDENLSMERFGLTILPVLVDGNASGIRGVQILMSEGNDTVLAWTVAPFLFAQGVPLESIFNWIGRGKTIEETEHEYQVSLPGLEFIHQPFALPDRFSIAYRGIRPGVPPVSQHPNYPIAQAAARYLIERGFVLQQ